jgi:hypothetical protein
MANFSEAQSLFFLLLEISKTGQIFYFEKRNFRGILHELFLSRLHCLFVFGANQKYIKQY